MKNRKSHRCSALVLLFSLFLILASCGPVIVSSRHSNPPPPWFYPNRVELVRYVYFPDLTLYYDLTARTYIYLNAGLWIRSTALPARYNSFNLNRSRYERVRNYRDDNIQRYHEERNTNRGRSNRTVKRKKS